MMNKVHVELDQKTDVGRRGFLKSGAGLLVGTLAASSGMIAAIAPTRTWAMMTKELNDAEASAILKVVRGIFPHDTLEDAVYALVVKDLDAAAADDAGVAGLLRDGLKELDKLASGNWASLDYVQRENLVKKLAGSPFFEKIRGTSVVSLYNNDMAWAHFGYEGSSYEHGGYFDRGFQDLDWLPDPSADASPAKA